MTIPSTPRRAGPFYGTAAQTLWPFTFKVFAPEDIAVIRSTSTGVETTLALGTDYTVTLNENQDTSPGGTILYPVVGSPLPSGDRLTVLGDLDYDQPLDLPDGGQFSPKAIENELDRIVMQVQQLREQLARAIVVSPSSDPGVSLALPPPAARRLIGWNQTGSGMQNFDPTDLVVTGIFSDWVYDTFVGDGTTTTFGLQRAPGTVGNTDVSVDGQTYVPNIDFTVSTTNLVFTTPPAAGAQILVRYGSAAPQGPTVGAFLKTEEKLASNNQTVFTLTNGYQPGIGSVSVYVNGQRATIGYDYLETNSTTVTFNSGLKANDRVLFVVGMEVTTGTPGRGITSIDRTAGTGAPGTTDTYTITYSDATTSVFYVYNGANGTGSGDVTGPASAVSNRIALFNGTTGKLIKDSGVLLSDLGDVDGPASATNNNFALFDGATGKLIKDGGVKAADFAAASHNQSSDTITHTASGTGAVSTTAQAKMRESVSVKDFGAVGDGTADDTAAFQAAHDALPTNGGFIYVPPGTYKLSSAVTFTKATCLSGAGVKATTLKTSSATANVLVMDTAYCMVENMGFDTSVTRTAGSYISVTKNVIRSRIRDFLMVNGFVGITLVCADTIWIENGDIFDTATGGYGIRFIGDGVTAAGNDMYVTKVTMSGATNRATAGIQITNNGAINITDCDIIRHGSCLLINPGSGETASAIYSVNSYFDSATNGIVIDPAAGGTVAQCRFVGPWAGAHSGHGVIIGSTGTIRGIEFISPQIFSNGTRGVFLGGGADVNFVGGGICGNTGDGVTVSANVSDWSFIGTRIGDGYGKSGNANGIVVSAGTSTRWTVMGCSVRGNTGSAISDSSTGLIKRISNNLGYNGATGSITVGASPFAYAAGNRPEVVYIRGGTVSSITVEGVTVHTQSNVSVYLRIGAQVVVTYSAAPTMTSTSQD